MSWQSQQKPAGVPPMILHDILWNSTVEPLEIHLKVLEVKPKNPNKANCIDAIQACYTRKRLKSPLALT